MGSKRRYRLEREPLYHRYFDLYRVQSEILNPSRIPSISTVFFDRQGILGEIARLQGNEKGEYYRGGETYVSSIPLVQEKLRAVDKAFDAYCQQKSNSGFPVPDKMPKELHEEQMKLYAALDVLTEELEDLQRRLALIADKEQHEDESKILAYGLRCSGKLLDGKLVILDGQKIIQVDGILMIANGLYAGMAVPDYRVLANRWTESRRQADRERLMKLQEQAKKAGQPIPVNLPVTSPHRVAKESLPAYPKEFKRYELE